MIIKQGCFFAVVDPDKPDKPIRRFKFKPNNPASEAVKRAEAERYDKYYFETWDKDLLAAKGLKRCKICKETKPFDEFYINLKSNTHISYCKPCMAERVRHTNRRDDIEYKSKKCPECGRTKRPEEYHYDGKRKDGLKKFCIECTSKRSKEYYWPPSELDIKREAVRNVIVDGKGTKRCDKCGDFYTTDNFYQASDTVDGLFPTCQFCLRRLKDTHGIRERVDKEENFDHYARYFDGTAL